MVDLRTQHNLSTIFNIIEIVCWVISSHNGHKPTGNNRDVAVNVCVKSEQQHIVAWLVHYYNYVCETFD